MLNFAFLPWLGWNPDDAPVRLIKKDITKSISDKNIHWNYQRQENFWESIEMEPANKSVEQNCLDRPKNFRKTTRPLLNILVIVSLSSTECIKS